MALRHCPTPNHHIECFPKPFQADDRGTIPVLRPTVHSPHLEPTPTGNPPTKANVPVRAIALSIVIPVHNEQESVVLVHSRVTEAVAPLQRPYEIIFINDGSTDAGGAALDGLAQSDARVKVIHFQRNFGQTAAMMAGFDHVSGEIVVTLDADLQNDPADIPLLLAGLDQGYDVCSGWRRERKDRFLTRVLLSHVANSLASLIFGVSLRDYGCTLKAYRREFLQDLRLYGEMHRFIPVYAAAAGARILEVVVSHSKRRYGKSKYGLGRVVKVALDLIVLKFLLSYAHNPVYVFGGFGLLSLCGSLGVFCLMMYFKFWGDKPFVETPLPLLAVLLFLMGSLSILMGLMAEVLMRTYYESQGKPGYRIRAVRNLDETE
jgi:glycosyltransferase involved in cell wall biosynthesis